MVEQISKEVDKHSLRDVRLPSYYIGKQFINDDSEALQDIFKNRVVHVESADVDSGEAHASFGEAFNNGSVKTSKNSYVRFNLNDEDDWIQLITRMNS